MNSAQSSDKRNNLQVQLATLKEEVKRLERKLAISNSAFLNIVGKSLDGIVVLDKNKMVVYTNYSAISLFDRNIADLLGEPLNLDIDPVELMNSNKSVSEISIRHSDGRVSVSEISILSAEWNNEPCFVVSFRDITERKESEKILEYMSHHDGLTGLPNRLYFEKQMSQAIEQSKKDNKYIALLYLDLDNFKIINDMLGHNIGDLLLKKVAGLLRKNTRENDMIARLGGDEFSIILNGLKDPSNAAIVAHNILNQLSVDFNLEGNEVFTSVSIGIAIYPGNGASETELIKNADTAMYGAKKNGRNQYQFFSDDINQKNEENIKIINGLRNVIRNNELILYYQPIIRLDDLTCCGVEALLRWQNPQLGLLSPNDFLPYAEKSGSIVPIGRWVVQQVLNDFHGSKFNSSLFVSINMSANELNAIKVNEGILADIKASNVLPDRIILELTETSIMRYPEKSINKFKELSDLGIKIAIDDYGTGYSSLSYLKKFPISILKIDKSFTEDIGRDENDTIIVKSTIQLAHNLGLEVITEGVEKKEQLDFLKAHDCNYVQGYYFSKPLLLYELKKFLLDFKCDMD